MPLNHSALATSVFALITALFLVTPATAQCTDADSDGHYYQADCGTPRDCNDAAPGIHPASLELCDGYDNDCDGQIDNHDSCVTRCLTPLELVGDAVSLSTGGKPTLIWNGTEYAVVWTYDPDGNYQYRLYFARLDSAGNQIGSTKDLGRGWHRSIVWNGSEYAIANYRPYEGAFFQRLDALGELIGDEVSLLIPGNPSLAWTGSEYGLAWDHDDESIRFKKLDASGQEVPGSEVVVLDNSGNPLVASAHAPRLVWSGDGFGLAYALEEYWSGYVNKDQLYFQALDVDGHPVAPPTLLTVAEGENVFTQPSIVWTGSEYGVTWSEFEYYVRFTRVDTSGDLLGSVFTSVNPTNQQFVPVVAWTGREYGLAWSIESAELNYPVHGLRLDGASLPIYDAVTVFEDTASLWQSIVWTGTEYGVVTDGLQFVRLTCGPCSDDDGDSDGYALCDDCYDADPSVFPGAAQLCDGTNNDCDDIAWPVPPPVEADDDGDLVRVCEDDCNDRLAATYPGAPEICDEEDNDCDGAVDEDDFDSDFVADCDDNCLGLFNNAQSDSDSDGIGGFCDGCPHTANPDQADEDGDGRGDACDCQPVDPNDREPGRVEGLYLAPLGDDSWLLEWADSPGADAYSVTRGTLSAFGVGSYGDCLAEGVHGTTLEDAAVPFSGEGYTYLVQAQNYDCGLGVPGYTSEEQARVNSSAGHCAGQTHQDVYAGGEVAVLGTVSGSYLDTFASDDIEESVREVDCPGDPAHDCLEHRWMFDLPPGLRFELHIEYFHDHGDESLAFEYSVDDGASWLPITMETHYPWWVFGVDFIGELPPDLSGAVLIRAVDTDRISSNYFDAIFVDELFVRVVP